jgi:hypothetical protein
LCAGVTWARRCPGRVESRIRRGGTQHPDRLNKCLFDEEAEEGCRLSLSLSPRGLISEPLLIPIRKHSGVQLWSHRTQSSSTADPRIHETPNLDSDPEFPDSESRFSQLMYLLLGLTLVYKLTESKFGIRKFGIGIEIRSLMYAGIGCIIEYESPSPGGRVLAVVCWSPCAQKRCYPTGRCAYRPSVTS